MKKRRGPRARPMVLAAVAFAVVATACGPKPADAPPDAAKLDAGHHATTADAAPDVGLNLGRDAHTVAPVDAGHPTPDAPAERADAPARDASAHDATTTPDATARDSTVADSPFAFLDVIIIGDVINIGPPPGDGSAQADVAYDGPRINACGICDRLWVCNGFTDSWISTSSDSCAYLRGGEAVVTLWCEDGYDTIDYADDGETVGTWKQTSTGLELDYNNVPGSPPVVIDCVPP